MKRYTIKQTTVTNGILYLTLEPNNKWDKIKFFAGQYATIGFKSETGRRSPMRCFSIVSSPLQNDDIQFAIRVLGKFTTTLSELPIGSEIFVQGPFGEFVIDEEIDKNLVFLAGGIGITPIMSMIRTMSLKDSPLPMTLLHSNKTLDVPFRQELKSIKARNPRLKTYHFITSEPVPASEANMLSGIIKEDHIKKITSGSYVGSTYFICGPKSFMDSMSELLIANGAAEDRIITETFAQSSQVYFGNGYSIQKLTYTFASALLMVGIIGISYIDLSRYVPKVANADSSSSISPSSSTTSSSTNTSSSSNTTNSSSNYTSGSSSNNMSSSSTNYQQTYQAPVTSVS